MNDEVVQRLPGHPCTVHQSCGPLRLLSLPLSGFEMLIQSSASQVLLEGENAVISMLHCLFFE